MAAAMNEDLPVLLLWLCTAALLFVLLETSSATKPLADRVLPAPQASPETEASEPEPPAMPALRTVSLPPPPPSPVSKAMPEPVPPSRPASYAAPPPPPRKLVRALKSLSKPAPTRAAQAVVPLRPAEDSRALARRPERPEPAIPETAPPTPAPATIRALKPDASATREQIAADQPPPEAEPLNPQPQDPAPQVLEPLERAEPSEEKVVKVDQAEAKDGRTLLRLLEHGSGPEIELAWPDSQADRRRLYDRLHDCFGMQIAGMDQSGRLYRTQRGTLAAWRPNMDLYSGFMRSPSGRLAPEEEALLRALRRQIPSAGPIRLFPRRVDALLLGGLRSLMGPNYGSLQSIQGRYRIRGARVLIEALQGDGRPVAGSLDLTPATTGRCSHAAS